MKSLVRDYEALWILSPDVTEETLANIRMQLEATLSRLGGRLQESAVLGKRKLSFPIGRRAEGIYLQIKFQLPPSEVAALEKGVASMEQGLRFMVYHPISQMTSAFQGAESAPAGEQGRE